MGKLDFLFILNISPTKTKLLKVRNRDDEDQVEGLTGSHQVGSVSQTKRLLENFNWRFGQSVQMFNLNLLSS